eukprot:2521612-Pleurochrysis_carterae.AAC.1
MSQRCGCESGRCDWLSPLCGRPRGIGGGAGLAHARGSACCVGAPLFLFQVAAASSTPLEEQFESLSEELFANA